MKAPTRIDDREDRRILWRFHAVLLILCAIALAAGVAYNTLYWRLHQ